MPAPCSPTPVAGVASLGHKSAGTGEDLAVLTLDNHGMIRHCNQTGETLFKYSRDELILRHVSLLLPQLAEMDLMPNGEPNPRLRFFNHIGRHFQAVTKQGEQFASQIFLNVLDGMDRQRISMIVRPAGTPIL